MECFVKCFKSMKIQIKAIKERLYNSPLFKDSFWALLGSVLGKGLSLLAGVVVARFLGKEVYGEYGLIKSTLLYISVFSTLGLGYTGTRYIAKLNEDNKNGIKYIVRLIYRITFISSSLMALVLLFLAPQVATLIKAPEMAPSLRMTAVIIIVNAINTSQTGIMSGLKMFKRTAINNIYAGVLTFLTSTLFTYFWGLDGSLLALLVSMCFNAWINYLSIRNHCAPFGDERDLTYSTKEIVSFSIPIALQESLYSVVTWLGSYLIIVYAGYGELGINSAALQWSSVVLFIPGVLKNVTLSYFSSSSNSSSLRKKMILVNFLATFIPCVFIAAFSSIINDFYGASFTNLNIVLIISCSGSIFSSISSVIIYELISIGKNWSVFLIRLSRDLSVLGLSWFFLSRNYDIQASILFNIVSVSVYAVFMCILCISVKTPREIEKI